MLKFQISISVRINIFDSYVNFIKYDHSLNVFIVYVDKS